MKRSASRISTYVIDANGYANDSDARDKHREPHERRESEQHEPGPDGRGGRHVLQRGAREMQRAGVRRDLVHAVLERELGQRRRASLRSG